MSLIPVLRGSDIWIWERGAYLMRNPLTGEERPKHQCDKELTLEKVVQLQDNNLNDIRSALGIPVRLNGGYFLDIVQEIKRWKVAQGVMNGLKESWIVSSSEGDAIVTGDALQSYLQDLLENEPRESIHITPVTGYVDSDTHYTW